MRFPLWPAVRTAVLCGSLAASVSAATRRPARPSGPARHTASNILWRDPGPVGSLNLRAGPAPALAPRPPFRFVEEERRGHSPKIVVADARGRRYVAKFGDEVHAEVFASRLVWALGYQVVPSFYVARGRVEGVRGLGRAQRFVAADGSFRSARFKGPAQLWRKVGTWRWDSNPFVGTHELAGLKIVTMLLSNWDDKDARDVVHEPNTGILLEPRSGRRLYAVTDWGTVLGRWASGGYPSRWNCEQYAAQSERLILGTNGRVANWGVQSFAEPISAGLTVDDIRWLMARLGRVTDGQLREALEAAGATPAEQSCYARAVRTRIERLRVVAAGESPTPRRPHRRTRASGG
jgi:hypothetical protein